MRCLTYVISAQKSVRCREVFTLLQTSSDTMQDLKITREGWKSDCD